MHRKRIQQLIIITLFFFTFNANSQQLGTQSLDMLEESPAGNKIIQLIQWVNSDEAFTAKHVETLFSQRLIDKIGTETLIGHLEEIKETDGQLELYTANRQTMFEYELKLFGLKAVWI